MKLYVVVVLLAVGWGSVSAEITVGSYDLGSLDMDKVNNNREILDVCAKFVSEYDIALLQGFKSEEVIDEVYNKLNEYGHYPMYTKSEPLGDMGDEYFVFYYNSDVAWFSDMITYTDGEFKYPPVAIKLGLYYGVIDNLYIGAIKIDRDNVEAELNMVPEAQQAASEYYMYNGDPEPDWLFLGKYYADPRCAPITVDQMNYLTLWQGAYTWWITDDQSTVTDPDMPCTPDRIVSYGYQLEAAIVTGSAHVNMLDGFEMDLIRDASDSYPVGIALYDYPMTAGSATACVSLGLAVLSLLLAVWM